MQEQEKNTLELVNRQLMRLSGVNSLDVEHGSLQVDGVIDSFVYVEEQKKRIRSSKKQKGFVSRLFS